jgi:hypothetical protein
MKSWLSLALCAIELHRGTGAGAEGKWRYGIVGMSAVYLDRLHKSGEPVVLTVNGKAQVVVRFHEKFVLPRPVIWCQGHSES